ncbi:serine/threonine protein kinase [Chloropicon primus]|uniref:non-specific serine/threonine protein kinase n=2 Tax=Chloropicon primus TaxID=1764295 RepID=A0A5B8MFF7_9CHLO|nr:serine/threonine protein kinase [Chloropicon primus]UPQ97255.1 serine/threonine protein kinase [Chloropicon primus]|eukprot:QDZ18040.1 serine/threonine protein kinase [Chloropicon primus]
MGNGRGEGEGATSTLASSSGSGASSESAKQLKKGEVRPGASSVLGKKFLIGEELGFGAFSKVYKGVDLKNGDFVAIKQISLEGLSEDDKDNMVQEIDLLRNLKHKNIVKYLGSYRTKSHLYIILEYAENGSLSQIIKPNKFGAFPESLAAIYMKQTLEGLAYLHEQNVIHRDVKGANILTTKEGTVKLADFGVATLSTQREVTHSGRSDFKNPVVGTPYWMAPEVIEMSGVTFASDIWSVGSTAIELLTGKPPYFDMMPMSALFHIVQDDYPPIPEGISPAMQDFLTKCFQKNAKKRPSARDLLKHDWFKRHNANFDLKDKGISPFAFPSMNGMAEDSMYAASDSEFLSMRSLGGSGSEMGNGENTATGMSQLSNEPDGRTGTLEKTRSVRIPFLSHWLQRRTAPEARKRETRTISREEYLESSYHLAQSYNAIQQMSLTDDASKVVLDRQLVEEVKRLIYMIRPEKREGIIISACQQCIALLGEHPAYKATFKKYKGVVALQEVVTRSNSPSVIHSILALLNVVMQDDYSHNDNVAVTGIIPEVFKFISPTQKEFNLMPIRLEAARFARSMCMQSRQSFQGFLACNGIQFISDLLEDICCSDHVAAYSIVDRLVLVEVSVDCIWTVVNGTDVIQTDDACRIFQNVGLVIPLVHGLKCLSDISYQTANGVSPMSARSSISSPPSIITRTTEHGRASREEGALATERSPTQSPADSVSNLGNKSGLPATNGSESHEEVVAVQTPGPPHELPPSTEMPELISIVDRVTRSSTYPEKVAGLLLIMSCSDFIVKSCLTENSVLQMIVDSIKSLDGNVQLMILACLKQLSGEPDFVENLHSTGSLQALTGLLSELDNVAGMQHKLIILELIWNMGQVDRSYLERASSFGLIPSLCTLARTSEVWYPGVLPLLFCMSSSGRKCRQDLWKSEAPKLFVALMKNSEWQQRALEALITWLASDGRIEEFLLGKGVLQEIASTLQDRDTLFALCHNMHLLCHRSPRVSIALATNGDLLHVLVNNLNNTDPSNLLSIMRFIDLLYQHHPSPKTVIITHELLERLGLLSQESFVGDMLLVKEKAKGMIQSLRLNMVL